MTSLGKKKQERYQRFRDEFITYENIFSLALACTSINAFSSDTMDWHRAVYEICQKYKESVPELQSIYFDHRRPPLPPLSGQVYTLQSTLMICGELEGLDVSSGHILRMPLGARPKIKQIEESRLAKYAEEIQGMAEIFYKHLKVKNRQ